MERRRRRRGKIFGSLELDGCQCHDANLAVVAWLLRCREVKEGHTTQAQGRKNLLPILGDVNGGERFQNILPPGARSDTRRDNIRIRMLTDGWMIDSLADPELDSTRVLGPNRVSIQYNIRNHFIF